MSGRKKDVVERPSEVRKLVYAVCEGNTERLYLKNFYSNNRSKCAIIDVKDKTGFDTSETIRANLMEMAYGEIQERTVGKYTPYQYISKVLHDQWNGILEQYSGEDNDLLKEALNNVRGDAIKRIKKEALDESGYVKDLKLVNSAIEDAFSKNKRRYRVLDKYESAITQDNPDLKDPIRDTSFSDLDRVFIVFDRDWSSDRPDIRSADQYEHVNQECEKRGYEILLSTPSFEFWLLLHHPGIDEYDWGWEEKDGLKVLYKLKELEMDQCSDWKGRDIKKVKSISKDRFNKFYNNEGFRTALEKSKHLPTDFKDLLYTSGTNVGIKLESLLDD